MVFIEIAIYSVSPPPLTVEEIPRREYFNHQKGEKKHQIIAIYVKYT
jgi:hypothetical protein